MTLNNGHKLKASSPSSLQLQIANCNLTLTVTLVNCLVQPMCLLLSLATISEPTVTLVNCITTIDNPYVNLETQYDNHVSQLSPASVQSYQNSNRSCSNPNISVSSPPFTSQSLRYKGEVPSLIIAHISERHRMLKFTNFHTPSPDRTLACTLKKPRFFYIKSLNHSQPSH